MSYSVSTEIIILIKQKNNNIVGDLSRTANKQHHMPQDNLLLAKVDNEP